MARSSIVYYIFLPILCGFHIFLLLTYSNTTNSLSNFIHNYWGINKETFRRTHFSDTKSLAESGHCDIYRNTHCSKREVVLSNVTLPLTGLLSFPGSGNTWTRHLIQQMTGIGTSSVYCDRRLMNRGFPFECQHDQFNKTIVTKSHSPLDISMFTRIILLIRNPYDALISYTRYRLSGHTRQPPIDKLKAAIKESSNRLLGKYAHLVIQISKTFKGPVYVLQYEKLKSNMLNELIKLSKFLGTNQTCSDVICTVKLQEGNFHRNATDKNHIQLLKLMYEKRILFKIQKTAKYVEEIIKNAYNVNCHLRRPK